MADVHTAVRAGGAALTAGAGTLVAATIADHQFVDDWRTVNLPHTLVGTFTILGLVLLLLGMPAWYAVQAHRFGWLGAASYVMTFAGFAALELANAPMSTYVVPALASRPGNEDLAEAGGVEEITTAYTVFVLGSMLMLSLGLLLFGVAQIRARVFPRALGWLIVLAPVAIFAIPIRGAEGFTIAALYAAIAVCGLSIARGRVTLPVGTDREAALV
jgi:hypothetical protein